MKYRCHAYLVVRVPFEVEAESQKAAIKATIGMIDQTSFRNHDAEYADEITSFLVDEVGDEENYYKTRAYDGDGELVAPDAPTIAASDMTKRILDAF